MWELFRIKIQYEDQVFIIFVWLAKGYKKNYTWKVKLWSLAGDAICSAGRGESSIDCIDVALSSGSLVSRSVVEQASIKGSGQGLQVLEISGDKTSDEKDLSKGGFLVNDGCKSRLDNGNEGWDFIQQSGGVFISDRRSKGTAVSGSLLDIGLQYRFVTVDGKSTRIARRYSVCVDL